MTDQNIGLRAKLDRQLILDRGNSVRYLVVSVTAPQLQQSTVKTERPPLNLSLVLDASGSMSGRPLEFAKRAAAGVIESLSERDVVSVISFASDILTHVNESRLDGRATDKALASISSITSRGMTNMSAGWFRGVECTARVMEQNPLCHSRVILLSDGHANEGITDTAKLQLHAEELRKRRLFTSTVGIGDGYSPIQLQALAEFGGGRMHDAERPEEIIEVLLGELGELIDTAVESVSVSLSIPPGVQIENLSGYPMELTNNQAVTQIGSLRAESSRSVVFKITAPEGAAGDSLKFQVAATWAWPGNQTQIRGGAITTTLTYANSSENSAQPRNQEESLLVAKTWQATVVRRTAELNGDRQTSEAERYLDGQLDDFRCYCRNLPGADGLIEELEKMRRVVSREWSERGLKEMHVASLKVVKNERDLRHTPRLKWHMYLPPEETDRGRGQNGGTYTPFGKATECFPFRMVDGHVLAEINRSQVLISTGIPVSISDGRPLLLGGASFDLGHDVLGIDTRELSRMVGERVDILLGNDLLRQTSFEIDPARMQLRFFADASSLSGKRLKITLVMGVPVLEVEINGRIVPMFLDPSAKVSYATSSLFSGQPIIKSERDFYPGFGTFTTDLRLLDVGIDGEEFVGEFGRLPPLLQTSLLVAGVEGILGSNLGRHFATGFDLRNKSIFLRRITVNAATA